MDLLTFAEAAAKAGVSEATIRRRVRDGALPEVKFGNRPRVRLPDLQRVFPGTPGLGLNLTPQECRVIGFANQKGGVGKSSCASNLAAILAEDCPVLAIDCDPQGNLTQAFGVNPDVLKMTTYNVLVQRVPIDEAILKPIPQLENLHLIGANLELAAADPQLTGAVQRESRLLKAIEPVKSRFPFIIIDCPPALSILTLNALSASTEIIIPVEVGVFSLRGVSKLMETIREIREITPLLERVRPLANKSDNTNLAKDTRAELEAAFGTELFYTGIRQRNPIREAQAAGLPVSLYRPRDDGTLDFRALADEIRGAVPHGENVAKALSKKETS
ncbi:MAG: hypothetical protein BGO01_16820 [Armatimonadetes bacterium 55-13]|nr:MAG: hypothetical protein BGO01_16820 [Armatimonadetes bacterium 55-13]